MNQISLLEKKIEELLLRQRKILKENWELKRKLEEENNKKQEVRKKIEKLLQKIEELNIE
ncbi:MAG TPA: hypothetical protein DIT19_01050 [Desulfonauticus sp.]|nr:MAG: hypothetical protein XD41_1093 [Desulfonauticus sp. 38_4375]HCO11799.1 hypothetical protein [Desulfonauticus sp.]